MNLKQIIVTHFTTNKDRVFAAVNRNPINELAAVRLEGEINSALIYVIIDLLDSTGTISKVTVEEHLEKRIHEMEDSKALLEVAKLIADQLPKEERDKLYSQVINDVMNEVPNDGQRPL